MNPFTINQIVQIVRGKLIAPPGFSNSLVSQIVIDSRTFFKGENAVFFALTGPRNNGHNYIPELLAKGIRMFIVSDPGSVQHEASFILVENTTAALQQLAAFNREQYQYPVIGITGSNGKTIIKEWLHDLLSEEYKIVRSPKSYNSQIGVPLSVLLMNKTYNLAIFEAGISFPGEMKNLAEIIGPEIGIFTTVGDAHQENFSSYPQKIWEKLLLFRNSKKLIYCVDSKELETESSDFCDDHYLEKISWSLKNNNAAIQFSKNKKENGTEINATVGGKNFSFFIPFSDDSAIENACHCFCAVWTLSKNPETILPRFQNLEPVAMRLEIKQGINHCLLINDYYNSDLNSLSIALPVLQQQAEKVHLHKTVILSDIQQTGISQHELYQKVNDLLTEWGIDDFIGIGPELTKHAHLFSGNKTFFFDLEGFEKSFTRDRFKDAVILIKGARKFTFEKISGQLQQKAHQTVLEINLNALVFNLNSFRALLNPGTRIMVMVKAFSYGAGDVEIAKLLQYQNVDYLAVAVADEGVQLRNAGVQTPVIVMNPEEHSFQNIIDYQLEPNIYSIELLESFQKAVSQNVLKEFPIHLKLDTGMNRLGFKTPGEIHEVVSKIVSAGLLKVKSVFSHLAASEDPDSDEFTLQQIEIFEQNFTEISKAFTYPIDRHILNSAGIERFPDKQFEMVRLGIGLYGISTTGMTLQNIGTLKSTVSQVKTVQENETVGYNRKGKVKQESRIAVVPMGYADGLDRKLGNKNGSAFINGKKVPVVGNICMDMLMLDVTGLDVNPGDEVEFFGTNLSITEVAEKAGTIPYEILTGISQRVKRVYIHE